MFGTISKVIKNIVGNKSEKDVKALYPRVDAINEAFAALQSLSNDQLRDKTLGFKKQISEHIKEEKAQVNQLKAEVEDNPDLDIEAREDIYEKVDKLEESITKKIEEVLEDILPQAFAVVKETARRFKENETLSVTATEMDRDLAASRDHVTIEGDNATWSNTWLAAGTPITWAMLHYDVQLIGGMVLHQGKIAEMATGEGKTLVATLPVYLNALPGRGVHVVTVNDYLAKRDSEWMAPIFQFHGLTVDCIDKHRPNSEERRKAYKADITYGTNNEFGFDYLRDNGAQDPDELVQIKHNYAIVDEVDSVLIDDARTPLIISGPTPKGDRHEFNEIKPKIERLVQAQRNLINTLMADAKKQINLSEDDISDRKELEKKRKEGALYLFRAFRGLPKYKALIKYLNEEGVKTTLQRTENFYLQDQGKEMHKVDDDLFFVIDEKQNSIELTDKGQEMLAGSNEDPNLFVLPDLGVEMDVLEKRGLPVEELAKEKETLIAAYTEKSERVHTVRQLLKAYTLFEKDVEYVVMDNKVKIVDEQTGRIMDGRRYSDGLHQAIEAKENVKIEAATQTYATITLQNYFRMYNKLSGMTGTAETESGEFWEIYKLDVVVIPTNRPIARKDEEDLVYKTKREKYNAVIDEIVKLREAYRPVLVGTTSVEVSELLSRVLNLRSIKHNVLNAKLHQREAEVVAEAGYPKAVTIATNMAGRGTDIKLGPGVKDSGGLAIIGTERHDSRRVDRQLRGRAGRQGDPGSSQFFVSLEDDLMRLFGSERIARIMDRLGLQEGEEIQHSMITKSIERAQRKVEENNFGIRKRLLEYDDVMNSQREVVYRKRRNALFGERMGIEIASAFSGVADAVVADGLASRDFSYFEMELIRNLAIESPVTEEEFMNLSEEEVSQKVYDAVSSQYGRKSKRIAEVAYPVLKDVVENGDSSLEWVRVPFTDGRRGLDVRADLKKAYNSHGREVVRGLEKAVNLVMIDLFWKQHLRDMDDLRQSVQNAVYEQKDPLLVYKLESFELFSQMREKLNQDTVSFLIRADLPSSGNTAVQESAPVRRNVPRTQESRPAQVAAAAAGAQEQMPQNGLPQAPQERQKPQPVRVEKKIGRNDPCPCGSGKKYKQCHGGR